MPRLHINVDHVATVRQARRAEQPDPLAWALAAEAAGAHGITCHLRADRRHIQDADVRALRHGISTLLNLECCLDPELSSLALESGADEICLVPEKREELTTEGGLDVVSEGRRLAELVPRFHAAGMQVSLFIDPDPSQLAAAAQVEADFVELHTGPYANSSGDDRARELERLLRSAQEAHRLGLRVNAGHGLDYHNVEAVAGLEHLEELNIGYAIVARSLFDGVARAVGSMLELIEKPSG